MDHRKLALIHIVKKELELSDEAYRAILRRAAGVDSARDLTETGFRNLMRALVGDRGYVVNPAGLTLKQKLYLEHLQQNLGWSDGHLANFLRKYYGATGFADLSRRDASKAILALTHMLKPRQSATST